MYPALSRLLPSLLIMLCLAGCGQTGRLFLRMPATAVPAPLSAPPLGTQMTPLAAFPGGTAAPPVAATLSRPPAAHP